MKVFYRDEQSAVGTDYYSPSPKKPALAVESWKKLGLRPEDIIAFEPVTRKQLCKVHDPHYVNGVLDGRLNNGFGDRDARIINVLPYVAGSMVAAVLHAFGTKETTFSPTSGAHHACYCHGGGFCTFNFLALAAMEAKEHGARKIAIIDCDMHYGNGTEDIIHKLDMHFVSHYTFAGDPYSHDARLAENWLTDSFPGKVAAELNNADVCIYNAGADSHVNDPLGGILTTGQMRRRDEIVLSTAFRMGVPVAISLAGGYQNPIGPVLDIHDNTYTLACQYDTGEMKMAA